MNKKNNFVLASMLVGLWVFASVLAPENYISVWKIILLCFSAACVMGGWAYFLLQYWGEL